MVVEAISDKYFKIKPGDTYTLERNITADAVQAFAELSGDYNPVHMDEDYVKTYNLGSRIVHGMLMLSYLSALIGMHLPGPGTVWVSQSFDFIAPLRIGDTARITVTVTGKNNDNALALNLIDMKVRISNQEDRLIGRGKVRVSVN